MILGSCNDNIDNKKTISSNNNVFEKFSICEVSLLEKGNYAKRKYKNGYLDRVDILLDGKSWKTKFYEDQYKYERNDNGDTLRVSKIKNGNGYSKSQNDYSIIIKNHNVVEYKKYRRFFYKDDVILEDLYIFKNRYLVKHTHWNMVSDYVYDGEINKEMYKIEVEYFCVDGEMVPKNGIHKSFYLRENKNQTIDSSVTIENYENGRPTGEFIKYFTRDTNKYITEYTKYNKREGGIIKSLEQSKRQLYNREKFDKKSFIVEPYYITEHYKKEYNSMYNSEYSDYHKPECTSTYLEKYDENGFLIKKENWEGEPDEVKIRKYPKVYEHLSNPSLRSEEFYEVIPVIYMSQKKSGGDLEPVGTGFLSVLIKEVVVEHNSSQFVRTYTLRKDDFKGYSASDIQFIREERHYTSHDSVWFDNAAADPGLQFFPRIYLGHEIIRNRFDSTNYLKIGREWFEKTKNSRTIKFNLEKGPLLNSIYSTPNELTKDINGDYYQDHVGSKNNRFCYSVYANPGFNEYEHEISETDTVYIKKTYFKLSKKLSSLTVKVGNSDKITIEYLKDGSLKNSY